MKVDVTNIYRQCCIDTPIKIKLNIGILRHVIAKKVQFRSNLYEMNGLVSRHLEKSIKRIETSPK